MGLGCVREIRRPNSDASDVGFRRCSRPWKFGMEDRENSDSYSVMILDLAKCFVTNNVRRVCRHCCRRNMPKHLVSFALCPCNVLTNVWSIYRVVDYIDNLLDG